MRFWHAAAFLLIACGGKIATESTSGGLKPGPGGAGDDDDDSPGNTSSTSGVYGGTSSSGYYTSSSGYVGTTSGVPYPGTSSGYTSSGSTSSSGTLCGDVNMGCGGDESSFKCSIVGPPGTPSLQCYGNVNSGVAKCNCYGTYLDGGTSDFTLKLPKNPDPKDLYTVWQKYCGGTCK